MYEEDLTSFARSFFYNVDGDKNESLFRFGLFH